MSEHPDAVARLRELVSDLGDELTKAVDDVEADLHAARDEVQASEADADQHAAIADELRERMHELEPREALLSELLSNTHTMLEHTGAVTTCMFEPCRRLLL